MTSEPIASRVRPRGLMATPGYARLWFAGGVGNAMRWLALLVGMAAVSAVLAALAWSGEIRVWHIALGGAVTGIAWASELAVRRRMLGEVVPADRVVAAVALDSLTNSVARVIGPRCGGAAFEALGLGGAYLVSAGLYLAASVAVIGLDFHQEPRRLRFGRIPGEIAEGLAVARATPAIRAVVLVSIVMNSFGFCYSALIPPIG